MIIKLMSYNIRKGFCDLNKKGNYEKNLERQKYAQRIVEQENPDILVLLEAAFHKGNKYAMNKYGIVQDYQGIFKYPFIYFGMSSRKKGGIVVLSRFLLKAKNYCKKRRQHLRLWFESGNGVVMIDIVHPSGHLNEEEKYKFVRDIVTRKKISSPYIMIGDLNALSPEDRYSRAALLKGYKRFDKKYRRTVDDLLKMKVISYLLKNGLCDTLKTVNRSFSHTVPTKLMTIHKETTMRIDYIFCSKDVKVLEAGIIKNEYAEKASDHYPIYVRLKI